MSDGTAPSSHEPHEPEFRIRGSQPPEETLRYPHVLRVVSETPWALMPSTLAIVLDVVRFRAEGGRLTDAELRERLDGVDVPQPVAMLVARTGGGGGKGVSQPTVAVLPVYGVIAPRVDMFMQMSGGTSLEGFKQMFRQALADPSVTSILLDVDSPGGAMDLVPEVAQEIRDARGTKPIVAIANTLAGSAAYYLASQADELVVTPSGEVGSIGVYAAHDDISKLQEKAGIQTTLISAGRYKTEGNPFEPLSNEARKAIQHRVDQAYEMFVADVAAGRGVSEARVRGGFGQGRVVGARDALEEGMVDAIETFDEVVERMLGAKPGPARAADTNAWASASFSGLGPGVAPATASSSDRREHMTGDHIPEAHEAPDTDPEAAPAEPTATVEPQARQTSPELEARAQLVADLRQAVADGHTEAVERMKQDLAAEMKQAIPGERRGYTPPDESAELAARRDVSWLKGADRMLQIHQRPASQVAAALRISKTDVEEFQVKSDNLLILSSALGVHPRQTAYYEEHYLPLAAAMDTATTAEGKEFVPTLLSSQLIERVTLRLLVAALFQSVDMPRSPFEIPGFAVSRTRGGKHSEQTADSGQTAIKKITPGTRKITLTAKKFAAEVLVSKEEEEESLIPILDFIQDEMVDYISADIEDAVLNGDTAGTHQDADVTAADDPRKNWDGLRKLAIAAAKTDASNAILTSAMLRVNRKKMGKYGAAAANLAHVLGISSYVNILGDSNVLTVDKYGPNAVILAGELARVDGIPIIVSEYVREDLNASGVQDGVTTNRSVAVTVRGGGYVLGNRRNMTIERLVELYAEYDQDAVKATLRKAFEPRYPAATEKCVALTYNLAL